MMTDNDLKNLYVQNLGVSEYAALRGVFDAGYAAGAGYTAAQAQSTDASNTVPVTTAVADDPTVNTQ